MTPFNRIKKEKSIPHIPLTSREQSVCFQCGGNGYMKTTPNCYQTCLDCLGRGLVL